MGAGVRAGTCVLPADRALLSPVSETEAALLTVSDERKGCGLKLHFVSESSPCGVFSGSIGIFALQFTSVNLHTCDCKLNS